MKNYDKEAVNVISYWTAHMLLFVGILAGGLLLGLPLFYLGDKYHISALQGIGGMIIFIGVLAARFTSKEIIYRMKEDETLLYGNATAHTLYGYLRFICFLPVFGPYIQKLMERKKAKNPFIEQNEKENGA